jgi:hypothetical protein
MMFWIVLMMLFTSIAINVYLYNKVSVAQRTIDDVAKLTEGLLELSDVTSCGIAELQGVDPILKEE